MWLVASVLDSTGTERFHHHRKFCETALVEMEGQAPLEVLLHKPRNSPFCDLSHAADIFLDPHARKCALYEPSATRWRPGGGHEQVSLAAGSSHTAVSLGRG